MREERASSDMRVALLMFAAALIGTCERLQAQQATFGEDAFIAAARAAAEPFRDRDVAIAAGYRRMGPSFPGMGEHWVHPGIVVRSSVSVEQPGVLCYAEIAGHATLVGVAYAFPLPAGQSTDALPGGADIWHIHDGTVDEETLLLTHRAPRGAERGARLVMTHVWTEMENPDGVFAQNNWRLPFAQAGVALTAVPLREAGQAISLLTAGAKYYDRLFDALAEPTDEERQRMRGILEDAQASVSVWRDGLAASGATEDDLHALASVWLDAWTRMLSSVSAETATRLAAFGAVPAEHSH